uniref:DNA-directed RNA polymerase III subunit RPC3 n=1 Tax=Kalanchoe fedtschenkoi TaxID=63787 RepID=A0A7N0TQ09_KALFE
MSTQRGIRLAVHLIDSHFGHLVSKVCECLLLKGSLTLNQIVSNTGLPRPDVKKCLLVLIQHNCIQPFTLEQRGGFEEGNNVSIHYTPLFDNILHRLRFSKFVLLVMNKLGKECADLLQGLLEHGRLTMELIIRRAAESTKTEAPDAVHDAFKRLVGARFVERCPDSEPFIELPTDEEATTKNRRSKFAKVVPQTIEQRAIAAAIPMEAKRFLISCDTGSEDTTETDKDAPSILSAGEKRKRDFSEIDDELGAAGFQKEVLWRPNFEEFVRCLRHKACIVHERLRLDEGAAIVLSAMLESSRNPEGGAVSRYSVPMSLNAIYEEVMRTEVGRTMTLDHVRTSLDQLGCTKNADDLYSVDLSNLIQLCRNEEVESFMLKKYGGVAYMIFRLLSKESRFFETDKISQDILKEKVETQKILFQMWQDNYLSMEKISTPAPKTNHFLLWRINQDLVWKQVLDGMYHAALNLINRVSFELNKEQELRELPSSRITGVLVSRKARLLKIRYCLESSLMRLDDAIMLFHDF